MITVLGIGPGAPNLQLIKSRQVLTTAQVVIGSPRQLSLFPDVASDKKMILPHLPQLKIFLQKNQTKSVVLLASGDPLLYGIGKWIQTVLPADQICIIPGISSIQYFFNKLHLSMNDCYLTSSHGKNPNFDFLLLHDKVAMVTDQRWGPFQIAQAILSRQQQRRLYIGENLSYPTEKISVYAAAAVPDRHYEMNVVIITNA